jgi:hypothetical protein
MKPYNLVTAYAGFGLNMPAPFSGSKKPKAINEPVSSGCVHVDRQEFAGVKASIFGIEETLIEQRNFIRYNECSSKFRRNAASVFRVEQTLALHCLLSQFRL